MNRMERRQKAFPMDDTDKGELKTLDLDPSKIIKGSVQWHILNLCRVLDYLGTGTIEHDYVVSILEDRLKEYEAGLRENSGLCDKCGLERFDPDCGCVCDCNHKCGRG